MAATRLPKGYKASLQNFAEASNFYVRFGDGSKQSYTRTMRDVIMSLRAVSSSGLAKS